MALNRLSTSGVEPWSQALRNVVRDVGELAQLLDLDLDQLAVDMDPDLPIRVPRRFVSLMRRGDPADPLLRQVLPLVEENRSVAGYVRDPLHEAQAVLAPGVIQKYAGRVLLIAAGDCAIHCRYCFRRNFPYSDHRTEVVGASLEAIRADGSVREVIASGGDPLMLTDGRISALLNALESMGHVRRFRIHTRLPVVIPSRITQQLVAALGATSLQVVVVLHVNHPNEIDVELAHAVAALTREGITLLNQAVLLAGINDEVEVLEALCERLFEARILPYYLHQLDPVAGTHHLAVCDARAIGLHDQLRERLPGYLVPRLARETPGLASKQWLA